MSIEQSAAELPDPLEGVEDDLRLQRELAVVGDVRVDAPAADGIGSPARRSGDRRRRVSTPCEQHAATHLLDARRHAFAGNRARTSVTCPS